MQSVCRHEGEEMKDLDIYGMFGVARPQITYPHVPCAPNSVAFHESRIRERVDKGFDVYDSAGRKIGGLTLEAEGKK